MIKSKYQPILYKIIFLASVFYLQSCTSINSSSLQENSSYIESFGRISTGDIAQNINKDIFKVGDIADISVYNVDSLSNTYVVDGQGNISFPLIGTIRVAGLSTTQLHKILTDRYGSQYLREPGINVKLESEELGKIIVDGAVNKPGVFEVNDIIRLTEAIALAEGIDHIKSSGSSVYITRIVEGEPKVSEVDLRSIRKLAARDPQIVPDDIIFVQDSSGRIVFREFLRTVPLLNTAVIFGTRP